MTFRETSPSNEPGVPQQQWWIFLGGIQIFGSFKKCWDFCEHNWWYISLCCWKRQMCLFFCGVAPARKKQMLRTNQKSRTLLRWHRELKICDNFCQLSLMIGESLKIYILGSCHLKRKCKSHTNNHFPNISGVEHPKICETTTIGIIPKPTDKVLEGMIWGPFYTSSLSNLDV